MLIVVKLHEVARSLGFFSNQTIEGLGDMVLSYLFPLKFISFIQLTY